VSGYKFNSRSIKEEPRENDEVKIISRETGCVEVKPNTEMRVYSMNGLKIIEPDDCLASLKPIMKK
jgi:hypothetical protein